MRVLNYVMFACVLLAYCHLYPKRMHRSRIGREAESRSYWPKTVIMMYVRACLMTVVL